MIVWGVAFTQTNMNTCQASSVKRQPDIPMMYVPVYVYIPFTSQQASIIVSSNDHIYHFNPLDSFVVFCSAL